MAKSDLAKLAMYPNRIHIDHAYWYRNSKSGRIEYIRAVTCETPRCEAFAVETEQLGWCKFLAQSVEGNFFCAFHSELEGANG